MPKKSFKSNSNTIYTEEKKELEKSKKPLVMGLILLLGVLGGVLSWKYIPLQKHESKEYRIELREEGFYPENITIHAGDTVKFVTSRSEPYWPASNLHPLHEIYPEFDPQRPIDPKDSWSFTFKQGGSWQYHDHLAPYYTGTVKVLPN